VLIGNANSGCVQAGIVENWFVNHTGPRASRYFTF